MTRSPQTVCGSLEVEHAVLILAHRLRELFQQQWLHINGTSVSHHLSSAVYTPPKLTMRLSDLI